MKKIIITIIAIICINILNVGNGVNAKSNEKDKKVESIIADDKVIVETFTSKEDIEKYGFPPNEIDSNVSTFAFPNDNPDSKLVIGPVYKTYSNKEIKFVAEILVAYVTSKIPLKISSSAFGNFTFAKLSNFSSYIKPTYIGSWVYETHDYSAGLHRRYNTLVHYSDSTYSKPIRVERIEVDFYSINYHK